MSDQKVLLWQNVSKRTLVTGS